MQLRVLLAQPDGVSAVEAAEALGCTRRTIYRDLDALQAVGCAIYATGESFEGSRWRILPEVRIGDAAPFTADELSAVWLALEALARIEHAPLARAARSALAKVRRSLSRRPGPSELPTLSRRPRRVDESSG